MLSVDQLTISARLNSGQPLLEALSFTVKQGETLGLVGPSGCGKTTLLRSVAGLIDPINGRVTIQGKTPKDLGWPTFRQKVNLVPQRPVLWDDTVCNNLLRPLRFLSVKHSYLPEDAQAMLAEIGLDDKFKSPANELSEGERQRICLVRSMLAQPDFMLLDEPTSALDEASVGLVERLLDKRMTQGSGPGLLIVTHDRAFADRFCNQVIDVSEYLISGQAVADA